MKNRDPRSYHTPPPAQIPAWYRLRDILITLAAWALWLYLSWDVLFLLEQGLLRELDQDPRTVMDWTAFFRQLKISYLFSGTVLVFLVGWLLFNLGLVAKARLHRGTRAPLLDPTAEAAAYGRKETEILSWRQERILTVRIDDQGRVLEVHPRSVVR